MMPADAATACSQDPYPFDAVLDAYMNTKNYFRAVKEAKAVCARCDFRDACLRASMAEGFDEPGVWAGLSEAERKKLRKGEAA